MSLADIGFQSDPFKAVKTQWSPVPVLVFIAVVLVVVGVLHVLYYRKNKRIGRPPYLGDDLGVPTAWDQYPRYP